MLISSSLKDKDPIIARAIEDEKLRLQTQIELIASENIVSNAVLEAQGSILTNKYAEGYPGRRYYGGCEFVDVVETLAIDRLKQLFNCNFANVQPHSGAQANQAVLLALLKPGETLMGMSMSSGGHLTHGSSVSLSGKWFHAVSYDVDEKTATLDYDKIEQLATQHKPRLIIAGGSACPRRVGVTRCREIGDKVGAYLMVDMAHFAGLVAGGVYPSPLPHAHVVTSTTHKTLRGPRGGIILCNDEDLGKKINSAVFPGLQGGPLMHVIAAKAVAFEEALQPEFKIYAKNVIDNAKILGETLVGHGLDLVSNGTDSHLLLVDLRKYGITGKDAAITLEHANITCNKNGIPFDPLPPMTTSGIRIGSPAATSRGFGQNEFKFVADLMVEILKGLKSEKVEKVIPTVQKQVLKLCAQFPIYQDL